MCLQRKIASVIPKKIAVIGGGPAGLVTTKVLTQYGNTVIGFEKNPTLGGLWQYQDEPQKKYATLADKLQPLNACYESLLMNTSKQLSTFSDYPPSDSMPTFMKHDQYLKYLQDYADFFNIGNKFKLNSTVVQLVRSSKPPFAWNVHYIQDDGVEKTESFDLVAIASGAFCHPNWPTVKNEEHFKGLTIHSAQVRRDELFEGKQVVIVGGSYSGGETATNAINGKAKKIYWTLDRSEEGRNYWLLNRQPSVSPRMSWDHFNTRMDSIINPTEFGSKYENELHLLHQGRNESSIDTLAVTDKPILTSVDTMRSGLKSGAIEIIPPIEAYSYNSSDVLLRDGTKLNDIDIVVYCTGFRQKFPFLDNTWHPDDQELNCMYQGILPVEGALQGLGFVLLTHATAGSLLPIAEVQARWLGQIWAPRTVNAENGSLFSDSELKHMKETIEERKKMLHSLKTYNHLEDPFTYVEALAKDMGCLPPDPEELKSSDKELATALLHGPLVPAQYRLNGIHPWEGARDYIIEVVKHTLGKEWDTLSL